MDSPSGGYDPRYLAGVVLFNRGDYFAAHEVWEDLWRDCPAADRRFYQGLIQAAVAIYHWGNGNAAGAKRLFYSGRSYMLPYPSPHHGLEVPAFWRAVAHTVAGALWGGDPNPVPAGRPVIVLDPPPAAWPDPDRFLADDAPDRGTA